MFRGDNSVRRMLSADVKSLSSRDSRNFCSRIKNSASSREAFSWRGMFDKCDSAFPHAPERTAFLNSETSFDSVLNPDSSDNVLEARLILYQYVKKGDLLVTKIIQSLNHEPSDLFPAMSKKLITQSRTISDFSISGEG